ncbi:dihydrofolate reductase [Alysiella filiformis]|uniref:Dihydrofolate reductase n=1 Tax=Alysiella filiformis DSM 16848 TaxID=1120981 RepID=A0A286E5N2_9NEIS|nr:dihydrofolate reductase [Alysiella filiformis]QMT30356.1 dihydrofolate reductase [Alysiella filiformis]UBQ56667.1 dihydrofolate reductase [Alysiella filiformis DSM 16848]SOD66210.1 dihydrofolate reductase [Alysiella filiformis DSM 16848]
MRITLVAALAQNRVIGANNDMVWHIAEDFAFFKQYTLHKAVIMGRKTWDSLPRKPLPQRRNMIITRQSDFQAANAEIFPNLNHALNACLGDEEVIIMGGAEIYAQALPHATDLRLTEVKLQPQGDVYFPEFSRDEWQEMARVPQVSANGIAFDWVHYVRK